MHQVIAVDQGSLAARHGVVPGDLIISINGETLIDEVDYQALTAVRHVNMRLTNPTGLQREVDIVKPSHAPLGLHFEDTLVCDPRSCTNNCVFCFVDQMPKGMRQTLYVKDDDWRLSLMMGNFVTLTNVNDREFERIIRRRASPLFISVHATNPEVRTAMLRQARAGQLMARLMRLKDEGLGFHCQIVLVPGINDGLVLEDTLDDLLAFYPSALSVALVPVGLTRFREDLTSIQPYSRQQALETLGICERYQQRALIEIGKRFVYPADELICIAEAPLPSHESYEGYPQIENGIGMIRVFDQELKEAGDELQVPSTLNGIKTIIACGVSIAPFMKDWVARFAPKGATISVQAITNRFFGESVTVSGLIVGADLTEQLSHTDAQLVLIPDSMLNSDKTMFLDDMSIADVEGRLGIPVQAIPCHGEALLDAMFHPDVYRNTDVNVKETNHAGI